MTQKMYIKTALTCESDKTDKTQQTGVCLLAVTTFPKVQRDSVAIETTTTDNRDVRALSLCHRKLTGRN